MLQQPLRLLAVALHSCVLLFVVGWIVFHSSPLMHMWQTIWFPLFIADLPASAVLLLLWQLMPDYVFEGYAAAFTAHPWGSLAGFWLPAVLYGTLGTMQWWLIGGWIGRGLSVLFRRWA